MKFILSLICPAVFGSYFRLQLGGSSSSRSENTTNNEDKRVTLQSGIGVSGDKNTLNVLDGNAINRSFDFGKQAFDFGVKSQQQAAATLDQTTALVKNAYADAKGRGAMTDYIMVGALALTGLVAVTALRRR